MPALPLRQSEAFNEISPNIATGNRQIGSTLRTHVASDRLCHRSDLACTTCMLACNAAWRCGFHGFVMLVSKLNTAAHLSAFPVCCASCASAWKAVLSATCSGRSFVALSCPCSVCALLIGASLRAAGFALWTLLLRGASLQAVRAALWVLLAACGATLVLGAPRQAVRAALCSSLLWGLELHAVGSALWALLDAFRATNFALGALLTAVRARLWSVRGASLQAIRAARGVLFGVSGASFFCFGCC